MRIAPFLYALVLAGCPTAPPVVGDDDDATEPVPSPAWCDDGRAESRLSSRRSEPLGVLPDDHWVLPNPGRRTGLQVHLEMDQNPELLAEYPVEWSFLFDAISQLDGWGLTSGTVFRFRFAVDPATVRPDAVRIVAFEPDGPRIYPADVSAGEFPDTIIVHPRFPLPHSTEVAVALTSAITSSDGTCVRQATHLRELLSPASELEPGVPAHALSPRYVEAAATFGLDPSEIVHMTVFTTQSTPLDSLAVRDDVATRSYPVQDIDCAPDGPRTVCETRIEVMDYRGEDRVVAAVFDGTPASSYLLPVRITLPGPIEEGPYPVLLIGHGLGGSRIDQGGADRELADMGFAVVATDAIQHGDHPTKEGGDVVTAVVKFFAITATPTPAIDPEQLRDNFRQSAWDRIQVLQAVREGVDLDADGVIDLDSSRMLYFGASLGGMMGAETMALSDDLMGGFVGISGGRISQIVTGSDTYKPLLDLMVPPDYAEDDLRRVIPVVQAVVDGGDPMYWARYVVGERLLGDPLDPPQLLSHYAYQDEVVPNVANRNHAHALGIPLVGREIFALEEAEVLTGPLSGNLPNGGTAGMQQFDLGRRNQNPDNTPEPVDHAGVLRTYESWSAWRPFLLSVVNGEPAVLTDPYLEQVE